MFEFFEKYEEYRKENPLEIEEEKKVDTDKLFEVEDDEVEPEKPTFPTFNEDDFIEKITAKLYEKLSIKPDEPKEEEE